LRSFASQSEKGEKLKMEKKITKRTYYATLSKILDYAADSGIELEGGITYESLQDFIAQEVHLLDNKAAASAKRSAAKKIEGDALREKIYGVLSEDKFMTMAEILSVLGDPDITTNMVTPRLTQLADLEKIIKETNTIPAATEGGRARKVTTYKKVNELA
jgi:hypothetical protein